MFSQRVLTMFLFRLNAAQGTTSTYVLFVSHKYQRRLCNEKKEEEEKRNKFNNVSFQTSLSLSLLPSVRVSRNVNLNASNKANIDVQLGGKK